MSLQTIYLVEDNEDNAELFCQLLEESFDIQCFKTGPDLLTYLSGSMDRVPDLFVLDISLPVMDGVSLMKKIRTDFFNRDIPILALTAHAMADDKRRLIQAGFDWYLSKPILNEVELFHVVDGLMSRSR